MKHLLEKLLARKARLFIKKHHPIIIGVTGSVGKTSTRNVIATILSAKFKVGSVKENYNNEIGLPLALLGASAPGKSILKWLRILLLPARNISQVYVLEYAVDHPGDMHYLCEIVKPKVTVFTTITPVHVEFFRSIEQLAEEKAHLLEVLSQDGLAVLNADDPKVLGLAIHSSAPVKTYGFKDSADVRGIDYRVLTDPIKLFATILIDGESFDITLQNQLGKSVVSSLMAAFAVGKYFGMSREELLLNVENIKLEPGRLNPIAGIKNTLILDSTYNAAPASMAAALQVLSEFNPKENSRRIAVLGHMAELGNQTEDEHRLIGMKVAELGIDLLIVVGDIAQTIGRGAIDAGMSENSVMYFNNPIEAGRWLDANIHSGDVVLVKGSQGARMEKVVKDIMAEPMKAEELLVRQKGKWVE